jgi:hypothetical protein
MEIPENGVHVTCDVNFLDVIQELPGTGTKYFVDLCKSLAEMTARHFNPKGIARNGFACKSYWSFANSEDMLAASLKFNTAYCAELGKLVGMIPSQQRMDYWFVSGSKDFHLTLQPSTFERVNLGKQAANFQATKGAKSIIDRRNKFAERIGGIVSHALILEVDLMEDNPPKDTQLEKHFAEVAKASEALRNYFTIK